MADKSRTEQAIIALVNAIDAKTSLQSFPRPSRNDTLDSMLENIGDGDGGRINVLDGDRKDMTAMTGAATADIPDGYDITHGAVVEVLVQAKNAADRDAIFDALMLSIHDAIRVDRSLGNVVTWCDYDSIQRTNLAVDGLPGVKAAVIGIDLLFLSNRPF